MNKAKHFETESGNFVKTAEFNGYDINERTFEDLMFQVDIIEDGTLKVYVKPEDEDFFSDFNEAKWLKIATEYAYRCDSYRDPVSGEDCWLEFETPIVTNSTAAKPIAINTGNPFDKIKDILGEETETDVELKEPKVGKFKTKRKYLNFVALANGTKVRFITDTATIDGKQLSGILEKSEFKFTICDEGIDIEEISDNKLADDAMLQRIAYELDEMTPNGYAGKFILPLKFKNDKNILFYLETEYQKPIDRLRSIFDELDQEVNQETKEENMEISEKGLAALDLIFGAESAIEDSTEVVEEVVVEPVKEETYLEKQFRLMNESKVNELKERIEKTQDDIKKYNFEVKNAEKMLNKSVEDLEVLETRLNSMTPADPANGYAFFVSDEQKSDIQLDDKTIEVATKISEMLKLKTDIVLKNLTESYYIINVANKDDFENKKITKEAYQTIVSIDAVGKFTFIEDGKIEYRGKLNWHQLTDKLIRKGFSQEPDFDKLVGSNSYESKLEVISDNGGFVLLAEKGISNNATSVEREVTKKVENPEFVQQTLRTFNKPETIVILGDGNDFQVTDDESSFDIYVGGKDTKKSVSCSGFGSILTLSEYKNWLQDPDHEGYTDIVDAFIVPGFIGTIGISARLDDGSYTTDFDMNDYIQHQFDNSYANVIINLPEGTDFYRIKNHDLSSVISVLRDDRIASVLADKVDNLTVFIGNKGGWLKNSDANKHIFDKLNFVGEMYEPKKGEKGEKICNTTTGSGKTYVRVRFAEGECVINQDKLR